MDDKKKDIKSMELKELEEDMAAIGEKTFRAKQIYEWMHEKLAEDFGQMTNIGKGLQEKCRERYSYTSFQVAQVQESALDGTKKFLFGLADGNMVESVWMKYKHGNSVCISSQVGCRMGCAFCASGLTKKKRDLTSGEMVAQVMAVQEYLGNDERVSHVVVMGTGEPFDNFENVMRFIRTVNHDRGLAIGARHITISTCGIVPKIYEFADMHPQYNLAISLHAPNDELRSKLMPVNRAYPLEELKKALEYYCRENNRKLTFEYVLLKGVNDRPDHAKQLAAFLRGMTAYVNLIPYNSVDEHGFRSVNREEAMKFYDLLMKEGVRCTIRKEHGGDIDAACGQLRIKEVRKGTGQ